jgi:apolipoprotein D and lipocalin family protein
MLLRQLALTLGLAVFVSASAFSARAELTTVPYVDASKYLTTWYKISGNPLFFEANCTCSRQVLGAMPDGKISVYNTCHDTKVEGPVREIRGTAVNEDPATNARFQVDFGLPQKGEYWIIGLDPQYRYAIVSDPSMKSLYILSQTPTLDSALYAQAVAEAATQVDTSKLQMTIQAGCTYP